MNKQEMIDKIYEVISPSTYTDFKWLMIGDVLDWIEKNGYTKNTLVPSEYNYVCEIWKEKCKPIDDQSEECITFIYNLIKDASN